MQVSAKCVPGTIPVVLLSWICYAGFQNEESEVIHLPCNSVILFSQFSKAKKNNEPRHTFFRW